MTTMFPMLDGQSVPWKVFEPFERRCQLNHSQSLRRIAERGGLGAAEAWAIVNNLDLGEIRKLGFKEAATLWQEFATKQNSLAAELEALTRERDELEDVRKEAVEIILARNKAIDQRDAELAELRKDKERLDWIVENFSNVDLQSRNSHGKILNHFSWIHTMPEAICTLREAIDSAMTPTASQTGVKGGEK